MCYDRGIWYKIVHTKNILCLVSGNALPYFLIWFVLPAVLRLCSFFVHFLYFAGLLLGDMKRLVVGNLTFDSFPVENFVRLVFGYLSDFVVGDFVGFAFLY